MELFYSNSISDNHIILDEAESRHCIKVLRHKKGDSVNVMDGMGRIYTGTIDQTGKDLVRIEIDLYEEFEKQGAYLHICVALTKNSERYEWFLEKAAEIGVDEITPLLTDHSERKTLFKPQRIENILVSASKQSQKVFIPRFNPLTSVRDLIDSAADFDGVKLIGYCGEHERTYIMNALKGSDRALILIGPEGDFTPAEIDYALSSGFKVISLSDTILRVETAALMAVAAFSLRDITG